MLLTKPPLIGAASVFSQAEHAGKGKGIEKSEATEPSSPAWDHEAGMLSPKDQVGESAYVVPREAGSEEGGMESENFVLSPEDQVGNVEYTSSDYHAGQKDPHKTYGDNLVAPARARGEAKASSRNQPQSSDASELPMGTNFVASKQGVPYTDDDVVGRKKPYSSDFPLPWSGTNSVFIGSHQGGDSTFSHQHGETDAAPGVINTVGRGSMHGYHPNPDAGIR